MSESTLLKIGTEPPGSLAIPARLVATVGSVREDTGGFAALSIRIWRRWRLSIRAKASISPMTARSTSLRSSDSLTRMSGRLDSPKGSADTRSITSSMRVFTLRCATWSLRTAAATASIGRCTSGVYARRASKHGPHGRNGSRYALVGVARSMLCSHHSPLLVTIDPGGRPRADYPTG